MPKLLSRCAVSVIKIIEGATVSLSKLMGNISALVREATGSRGAMSTNHPTIRRERAP